jgi:hypothetical protein
MEIFTPKRLTENSAISKYNSYLPSERIVSHINDLLSFTKASCSVPHYTGAGFISTTNIFKGERNVLDITEMWYYTFFLKSLKIPV